MLRVHHHLNPSPDHYRPGRHSPLTELLESAEQLGVDLEVDGELLLVVWNLSHVPIYRQNGKISGFSAGDPRDGTLFALVVDPNWEDVVSDRCCSL